MSKDLGDFDFDNLSEDDHQYFADRPWLKTQYTNETGEPFPEYVEDDKSDDSDDEDKGYSEWEYDDLKKEVEKRELETSDKKKDTLIAALEADDEDEAE